MTERQNIKLWEPVWAYGSFGWLLGTLTPGFCALLIIFDDYSIASASNRRSAAFLLLVVAICSVVGLLAGSCVGFLMKFLRGRVSVIVQILIAPLLGLIWGAVTGGFGGLPIFIIGGLFGAVIAGAVGTIGFALFSIIYELPARRFQMGFRQSPLIALGLSLFISLIVAAAFYLNSQ